MKTIISLLIAVLLIFSGSLKAFQVKVIRSGGVGIQESEAKATYSGNESIKLTGNGRFFAAYDINDSYNNHPLRKLYFKFVDDLDNTTRTCIIEYDVQTRSKQEKPTNMGTCEITGITNKNDRFEILVGPEQLNF